MKRRNDSLSVSVAVFFTVIASALLAIYLLRPTPMLQRAAPLEYVLRCLDDLWRTRATRDKVLDLWFHEDITRHVHLPGGGCVGMGCSYNKSY